MVGFEGAAAAVDNITLSGSAAYSTTQARTGSRSLRVNPGSGASGQCAIPNGNYQHFGLYIASLPSVSRRISGANSGGEVNLRLDSSGSLSVYNSNTLLGTSANLTTGTWYWIGFNRLPGTSIPLLQIDGVTAVTATSPGGSFSYVGAPGTEASAIDIYFDDVIVDPAGFLAPSNVALLLPVSDNYRDTLWTGGSGGTTNLYDAVNNVPPAGLATENNTSQIEHAGGAAVAGDTYSANMSSFANAGIGSGDTLLACQNLVVWGEDSATGTKMLRFWSSNPNLGADADYDVSTGDGSGATLNYGAGPPDYWNERRSAIQTSPSITYSSPAVMSVGRWETASRVASVCFMGMYIAWTPAATDDGVPRPLKVYPQLLAH